MFKRVVSILLAVVMVFSVMPNALAEETETVVMETEPAVIVETETETEAASESGTELGDILGDNVQTGITEDGLEYAYNDTQAVITGYSGTTGVVRIPKVINDHNVVGWGDRPFYNNDIIKEVVIEAEISEIADYCFYSCDALRTVQLPETLTKLGERSFCGCSSLKSICIPDDVTHIGSSCFSSCGLLSDVEWPESLVRIGDNAFNRCESLASVPELDGVAVAWRAFEGCTSLKNVVIRNIDTLEMHAFVGCTGLESLTLENVETIDMYAFSECTKMEEINLSSIGEIRQCAFENCALLTKVEMKNVNTVGASVFKNCTSLQEIDLMNVKEIESMAFYGCSSLGRVILPDGLESLGVSCFAECSVLTVVRIPSTVTSVGENVFYNDHFLTVYGEEDSYAESWCSDNGISFEIGAAPEVNVGSGVTEDGIEYIFSNGSGLIKGYSGEDTELIIPKTVADCNVVGIVYGAFENNDILESVAIEAEITQIPGYLFYDCDSLKVVDLPDTIESIGTYSFYGCEKLNTILLPNTVTEIGNYSFMYCYALESIALSAALETIGSGAFKYCRKLCNINWSDGTFKINGEAFLGCSALTEVKFEGVSIGTNAFENCKGLVEVSLINCSLETSAFQDCIALKKLVADNTSFSNYAFAYCTSLEEVSISNTSYLRYRAFYECAALTLLQLDHITEISQEAFYGCKSLQYVVLPTGTKTIDNLAFAECAVLSGVYIPDTVTSIKENAFLNDCLMTVYGVAGSQAESFCETNDLTFIADAIPEIKVVYGSTEDGLQYAYCDDRAVILGYEGLSSSVVIPKMIEKALVIGIESYAFHSNNKICELTILGDIKTIPDYCFYLCPNIEKVLLPDTIEMIGTSSFHNCGKLASINWPEKLEAIGDNAFLGSGLTEVVLSDVSVGALAFNSCKELKYLSLDNVDLEWKTFMNCSSLESAKVKSTYLPEDAFNGCTALESVTLEKSGMWTRAFYRCTSLQKIIIPDGVTKIPTQAFAECTTLSGVYIPASVTTIADDAFENDQFLVISAEMPEENEDGTVDTPPAVDFADKQGHKHHKIRHKHKDKGDKHNGWHGQMDHDDAKNHDGKHGMYIMTDRGWVWFDPDAVGHIQNNMGSGDLEFGWDEIDERPNSGNDRFDDRVEDVHNKGGKVYDLNLKCGGEKVEFSKDEKGSVHVDVPFEKGHENVYVYHIDDEGNKTRHDCDYDPKTGRVSFDTRHFSYYSVETVENDSVVIEKFDIAGANMTLGNELEMNVMFPKTAIDNAGTELTAYVTHYSEDGDVVHTFTEFDTYGSSYYKISFRVNAAQMTDTIAVEFKDADGNVYNNEYTNSVRNYVMSNISRFNSTIQTLMVDMLNYGAAAQDQFTYHQDEYANALLSDAQKALATGDVEVTDLRVKGTNYAGSTLSLEDRILLNLVFNGKFTAEELAAMSATVSFDNALDGVKQTHENATITAYGSSRFQVTVDQIVLADSSQPVTVTVYNADGTEYGSAVDSVSSYIYRMDDGTNPMYSSIMKFATSALAYGQSK